MKSLQDPLKIVKKHPKYLALCSLVDLGFFFIISLLLTKSIVSIKNNIEAVYRLMNDKLGQTKFSEAENFEILMKNQDVLLGHYDQIMQTLWVLLLTILLAWIILQGINWFLAHRLVNKKVKFQEFAKQFTIVSVITFAAITALFYATIKLAVKISKSTIPVLSHNTINILTTIGFILIAYLTAVAIAVCIKKNWHKMFIKKAILEPQETLLPFVGIILGIAALNYILLQSLQIHWTIFAVLSIFIVLPSYTFARIVWIKSLN